MKSCDVTIFSEEGLHARPAANFVDKSLEYKSKITVEKDGEIFNAKSITAVLSMGACKNDTVTIRAEGQDEEQAISALMTILSAVH